MNYAEHYIERAGNKIYVRDYPGRNPPLILMHGFPDSMDLYDYLLPLLVERRRVITFDFIGWGRSDKPEKHNYTFRSLTEDLDTVVELLKLERPILVAHDASGPPAIDWAIANAEKVGGLVLLNTFYMMMLTLKPPEAIFLYMTPVLKYVTRLINCLSHGRLNFYLYHWQLKRFIREPEVKSHFIPKLYSHWEDSALSFQKIVGTLLASLIRNSSSKNMSRLRSFKGPVRIIFGAKDPYLNVTVARRFHREFSNSELFLVNTGYHYVQIDEPEEVARLILEMSNTKAAPGLT